MYSNSEFGWTECALMHNLCTKIDVKMYVKYRNSYVKYRNIKLRNPRYIIFYRVKICILSFEILYIYRLNQYTTVLICWEIFEKKAFILEKKNLNYILFKIFLPAITFFHFSGKNFAIKKNVRPSKQSIL